MPRGKDGSSKLVLGTPKTPKALRQEGEKKAVMAEGKSPLDGILEEGVKTQEEVRQNNQSKPAPAPTVDDGIPAPRRIREVYPADIEKLQAKITQLQAMILAMRGLVGACVVGVMYSLYKIRKLESKQKALPEGEKPKAIEVEAKIATQNETPKVGD